MSKFFKVVENIGTNTTDQIDGVDIEEGDLIELMWPDHTSAKYKAIVETICSHKLDADGNLIRSTTSCSFIYTLHRGSKILISLVGRTARFTSHKKTVNLRCVK